MCPLMRVFQETQPQNRPDSVSIWTRWTRKKPGKNKDLKCFSMRMHKYSNAKLRGLSSHPTSHLKALLIQPQEDFSTLKKNCHKTSAVCKELFCKASRRHSVMHPQRIYYLQLADSQQILPPSSRWHSAVWKSLLQINVESEVSSNHSPESGSLIVILSNSVTWMGRKGKGGEGWKKKLHWWKFSRVYELWDLRKNSLFSWSRCWSLNVHLINVMCISRVFQEAAAQSDLLIISLTSSTTHPPISCPCRLCYFWAFLVLDIWPIRACLFFLFPRSLYVVQSGLQRLASRQRGYKNKKRLIIEILTYCRTRVILSYF